MLRTLLASLLALSLSSALPALTQDDDFAGFFGDDPQSIEALGDDPGHNDIDIIQVKLDDVILIDSLVAHKTENGLCLPAKEIFEALEFPVEVTEDTAQGWFISENRTLSIDFTSAEALISQRATKINPELTDDGWCLLIEDWTEVLPIDFTYEQATQVIKLKPREVLPLEARLERQKIRDRLRTRKKKSGPDYDLIEDPYRWISLPTADITMSAKISQNGKITPTATLDLAGDLMKMSGRVQLRDSSEPRITLSRTSELADQLGFLKARSFSVGDVVSVPLPLISNGQSGRGFVLSNRPTVSADVFDVTDIRGPLPVGWEAELYEGEQLLGFVTEPDENGDYVFRDIPLNPGYNRRTVKLFGPYGEKEERQVKITVGADMCPENEVQYSFSLLKPSADPDSSDPSDSPVTAYASVRHGLSKRATAQIDAQVTPSVGKYGMTASLSGTAFDSYGVIRLATEGKGRPAIAASFLKQFEKSGTRLQLDARDFGDVENEISGFGDGRTTNSVNLSVDTNMNLGLGRSPSAIRSTLAWKRLANGSQQTQLRGRISGTFGATRWSNSLSYNLQKSGSGGAGASTLGGTLLVARSVKGVRLRGTLNYSAQDRFKVTSLSLAAQKRLGRQSSAQISVNHDMSTKNVSISAGISKTFRNFIFAANAGASDKGEFNIGMNLSFALFNDRIKRRYRMAAPGLTRSGAISAVVFDDLDDDGVLSETDTPIADAGFIVAQSLRSETTNQQGVVVMNGLQAGAKANVELKLSTLPNPFQRPVEMGLAVRPRPGHITQISVPLTVTGDADGMVTLKKGDEIIPKAGVPIEVVDHKGNVLATERSDYEGYFYIDGIPAGELTLRISEQYLKDNDVQMAPVSLKLTRDWPSAMNLKVELQQTADSAASSPTKTENKSDTLGLPDATEADALDPPAAAEANTPNPPAAAEADTPNPPAETGSDTLSPPAAAEADTPNPPAAAEADTPNPPDAAEANTPNPPAAAEANTPNPPAAAEADTPNPPAATGSVQNTFRLRGRMKIHQWRY